MKNKGWFGYCIFCIIATIALLYYRFPSNAIRDYLQSRAQAAGSAFSLSIERVRPWIRLGLRLEQTQVSRKGSPGIPLFRTDTLFVRPVAWSFLKGERNYCFRCPAYGGDLEGRISCKQGGVAAAFGASITIKDILLGTYGHLKDVAGRQVDGLLSGAINYEWQDKALLNGTGEANLKVANGRVELMVPLLNMNALEFDEIFMDMVFKKRSITVTRFELQGPLLKGSLSGTVYMRENIAESRLNLQGKIEPFASFFGKAGGAYDAVRFFKQKLKKGTLSFIIRGTIGHPLFTLT